MAQIQDEYQGCGVGVEPGVGVSRSRPFCLESETELESVKFCRLRLRPGVGECQPSTDNDFVRTVMHRPENIETQKKEEWQCENKVEASLCDTISSDKGYWK